MPKKRILVSIMGSLMMPVFSAPFKIADIQVEGLQRLEAQTVFNYLPLKPNDVVDLNRPNQQKEILNALYQSQLFSDIKLKQNGNILIIQVEEYPVIGEIKLEGNRDIKTDDIKKALGSVNFIEGQSFNPATLKALTKELDEQYQARGKYNVQIEHQIKPLGKGRVGVYLNINEGRSGRIKSLDIVGNKAYNDDELSQLFDTTTGKWNSWLTKSDQYNNEKLQEDLKRLTNFYLDRGFMDFQIQSTVLDVSSDKAWLYLTVNLKEGQTYRISNYQIIGDLIVPETDLKRLVAFEVGELYNQSLVDKTIQQLKVRLADEGYARAEVKLIPKQDKLTGKTELIFAITPNQKTYVRQINFTGNEKTYDVVLRRELRQDEASLYSASNLNRSLERLKRLPQVQEIEQLVHDVSNDEVDVEYKIKENNTNSISGGVGYGQSSGALFTVNYNDENFFGTGYQLGVNFGKSSHQNNYGLTFTDPYFTPEGITASYHLSYSSYDYKETDISDWSSDNWEASMTLGYPLSEYQKIYVGGGLRGIKIKLGQDPAINIQNYLNQNGKKYREGFLSLGWSKDSLNHVYLPTQGHYNRIGTEITTDKYYKVNYEHRSFFGFGEKDNESFIIGLKGEVNYGGGFGNMKGLPFYRHYYSGGINTVRGFEYGTLGPTQATVLGNRDYQGGDFAVNGSLELMMPWRVSKRSNNVRIGAFVDFGNVYDDFKSFKAKEFRYSTGLFLQWISPVGPLNISYAKPLNKKVGDKTEAFQFTIGTTF